MADGGNGPARPLGKGYIVGGPDDPNRQASDPAPSGIPAHQEGRTSPCPCHACAEFGSTDGSDV